MTIRLQIDKIQTGNPDERNEYVRIIGIAETGSRVMAVAFGPVAKAMRLSLTELAGTDSFMDEVIERGVAIKADGNWFETERVVSERRFKQNQFRISKFEVMTGPSIELFRLRKSGTTTLTRSRELHAAGDVDGAFRAMEAFVARMTGMDPLTLAEEMGPLPEDPTPIEEPVNPELDAARRVLPAAEIEALVAGTSSPEPTIKTATGLVEKASAGPAETSPVTDVAPSTNQVEDSAAEPEQDAPAATEPTEAVEIETPVTEDRPTETPTETLGEPAETPVVEAPVDVSPSSVVEEATATISPPAQSAEPAAEAPDAPAETRRPTSVETDKVEAAVQKPPVTSPAPGGRRPVMPTMGVPTGRRMGNLPRPAPRPPVVETEEEEVVQEVAPPAPSFRP